MPILESPQLSMPQVRTNVPQNQRGSRSRTLVKLSSAAADENHQLSLQKH